MSRKSRNGGVRTVVYLSMENYLALMTAVTPSNSEEPRFGAVTKLVNGIMDEWRARRALASTKGAQK